jgi:hypothetical protein
MLGGGSNSSDQTSPFFANFICLTELFFVIIYIYEVGSITNANGPISQQLRNIAKKFKKAAQTTFISCAEKKSFVC